MTSLFVTMVILWLGHLCDASAQTMVRPTDPNYASKVKLVDEFFDRFNGKEITPYIDKNKPDYKKQNLLSLFNIGMFKSRQDPLYIEADSLIGKVLRDSICLDYRDSIWFAKAKCLAIMNGKETELTVWLNVEKRTEDMSKWVIARAEGEVLKMIPPKTKHNMMLLPNDHETNFISLHRMTKDTPRQSMRFARKDFTIDETSVFFTLVSMGLLKIEFVTDLQFVFYQVPGYRFSISYFEREKANCGWLISSFERISEREKDEFISKMHK